MEITAPNFEFIEVEDIVRPLSKIRNSRKVRSVIRKAVERCSLVVARVPSAVSTETVRLARALKKPYLLECVACNQDALWHYNWKGKLAASWYARKQRNLIWQAPFVLYVTHSFLQSRYPSKGKTVGVSNVAIGEVNPDELRHRLALIEEWESSGRPLRLATIGDLDVPYKAQADVVRAVAILQQAGIPCEYHLVGGGNPAKLASVIRDAGVESQVKIHGTIPHAEIFSVLRKMDLYVHPSRTEGLPRAVVESFSVALPAIGSRVGGIPELLAPDRLFKAGSVEEIVKLIKTMNSSQTLQQDASANWERARDFVSSTLEQRRADFFKTFLECNGLQ